MKLNTRIIFITIFFSFYLVIKCNILNSVRKKMINSVQNNTEPVEQKLGTAISTQNFEARDTRWSYYYMG